MKNYNRTTVTAALIYANGPIHIGHLAGCYIPADTYVRYLKAKGEDVAFVSGTDEHGVPITIRAKKEGVTPQEVVDKYYEMIKQSFADFGIAFDIYSRTSKPQHHQVSQEFFTKLYENGHFIEDITEQYYDEVADQFLADRYIVGTCPVCSNENAYGDQCEKCGSTLSPMELKNPRSMLSGSLPVLKTTKNWSLPLDKMQPMIEKYVNGHQSDWKNNVFGQCQSWLKQGLQPRAMTRDLDWGIKVPLPDTDGKVLYVWFDAPIGYITFTQELKGADWEKYWKADDTRIVHFIGKDNIVFHCIIFPAMLMAEGTYQLADNVPAFEFMNLEGEKISTSRNWAVWLHEYLEEFPNKQDVLRYALTANGPEAKDADFTWADFQARNNNELVAIFGNFINRAIVLTQKNFDSKVPARAELTDTDRQALTDLATMPTKISEALDHFKFREALALFMDTARLGNKYLAETEPWKAMKTDPARAATILNVALQISATLSIVAEPFLPFTAQRLREMLKFDVKQWNEAGKDEHLVVGHTIENKGLLFEKIEDTTIQQQVEKLHNAKKMNELATKHVSEIKPEIQYDDFAKMDIRIGTVLEAERVPKSKKLLKLKIDDGIKERTILSGIAEHFDPESLIGKQVTFLANLAPRKMMGMESEGMVLMAEDRDGSLALLNPHKPVWNGGGVS
jgi:methionyl-tRNA synthetase